MGTSAWAARYINSRFAGCECVGKVRIKRGPHGNTPFHVYLFKLTHDEMARRDGRPFGAWYQDGATMIWPREWAEGKRILAVTEEELDMLDETRARLAKRDAERKASWEARYGRVQFDGPDAGASMRVVRVRRDHHDKPERVRRVPRRVHRVEREVRVQKRVRRSS